MVSPFTIIWRAFVDVYSELFTFIGMNLLWLLMTLPLGFLVVLVTGLISGIPPEEFGLISFLLLMAVQLTPNPGATGLHNYVNRQYKEERIEFELFKLGLFRYWRRAFVFMAIGLLGYALLIGNMLFYLTRDEWFIQILGVLFVYGVFTWAAIQMYIMPLLIEQENKSYRVIYRNAAVLALDNLLVSIVVLFVLFGITFLSVGMPVFMLLLSGAIVAAVQHRTALTLLDKYRNRGQTSG